LNGVCWGEGRKGGKGERGCDHSSIHAEKGKKRADEPPECAKVGGGRGKKEREEEKR